MSDSILSVIQQLQQCTTQNIQGNWRIYSGELDPQTISATDLQEYPIATLNEKGYIVWSAGRKVQWLIQNIIVPETLQGYPVQGLDLRLCLTWWSEDTQVFVNGECVQAGDLFDSSARVLLTSTARVGDEFLVSIRLVSPGHDIGALMRSHVVYENSPGIDPGFVAQELQVLHNYWSHFEPEKLKILQAVTQDINQDWVGDQDQFHAHLQSIREQLIPYSQEIKQREFHIMGHAHLDMAWLWDVSETYQVAQRTFSSVLNLQQGFPDLTFCHTSPVLYEWIENHRPDLFAGIQGAYQAGKWDVLGGMWVEPDVNLVNGESLVRQILYGQKYIKEKFGEITKVAWLTDSFGFTWQLPQILKQGGIDYFVTQKLHWNDSTKFDYGAFWWESPDGTRVFTLMSPPNVTGVMDTHPITMTNYSVQWEEQTGLQDIFWLPGVGDHGGGPSRDMLEVQQRWQGSPFFPKMRFTKAEHYLGLIQNQLQEKGEIPVWQDELYLEFHRGCYTTHGDQKRLNRRCEGLLYQAELWATIRHLLRGTPYPQQELEWAWKQMLFNQFHDILPGTSIPEVFEEANVGWEKAIASTQNILHQSLLDLASHLTVPPPPVPDAIPFVVFNPLNWTRSHLIQLSWGTGQVFDPQGHPLPSQLLDSQTLLVPVTEVPGLGYAILWWQPQPLDPAPVAPLSPSEYCLENAFLRVQIDSTTGDICQVFSHTLQRDILSGPGNQLQFFQDQGQYWDAWNIDPNYENHSLPPAELKTIEWIEQGPLRCRLRVVRQFNQSQFCQDYLLEAHSPILHIETTVDWQERHVLVKAAFPLPLEAHVASYEIACGTIERTTQPQTPQEKAKWEVPALNWADLTDQSQAFGVSLLNHGKYGYDAKPNALRLTLLRSPQWPHPECDRGTHHFTYSLYPHSGTWQTAKTVHHGYELHFPLSVSSLVSEAPQEATAPATHSFLDFGSETLILMACKPSEQGESSYIVRCYEAYGQPTHLTLNNTLDLIYAQRVNLLEVPESEKDSKDLLIQPWQIVTLLAQKQAHPPEC